MNIEEAFALLNEEYESDKGLLILFRRSDDVDEGRLDTFLEALKVIRKHYQTKVLIEKKLVYRLLSLDNILKASSGHWKVSRPKGLTSKKTFEIYEAILGIFSDASMDNPAIKATQ